MANKNLSKEQNEFLQLCIIEQEKYDTIAEKLGVSKKMLSEWYDKLKDERIKIASIRTLYKRKKIELPFNDFYNWYISTEKKCFYCGITEEQINELIGKKKLETKRLETRGKKLELDRKEPNLKYDELHNLAFACYWCNNAKTDTFTSDEFQKVGEVIKEIWANRLEE